VRPTPQPLIVAGIDGYGRGAWVSVVLNGGRFSRAFPGRSLAEILPRIDDAEVIGIDIPIGLPDGPQRRQADLLARLRLGKLASTVFLTPPRAVLEAATFADGNRIAVELTGKGLSMQAFGLRARIFEAEAFARVDPRICEVHPEVSFAALNGGLPLADSKASWVGLPLRRGLLAAAGIRLPDDLGEANRVPVDDVLDAAAAAWSAFRVAAGIAESLPDPPEEHSDGIKSAIRV
jgi:predicted RNase H-like nuclease